MVKIQIDMQRRNQLRRLHTATHIVNFCAREVLGNHVWQNGSNLKPEEGSLDITHYDQLTSEQIFQIEAMVNDVIFENKKVTIEELDRAEAEKKYGFILYQGGAIPMKTLRVIKVLDNDIEACGGIHMESTGGIGYLKITDSQKIQDGVIRLKYVVREFAQNFIEEKQSAIKQIQEIFSVPENQIVKTSEKFFNDWKEQKKTIDSLQKSLKEVFLSQIESSNTNEYKIDLDVDMGFLLEIFTKVFSKKESFKLISKKFIIATQDVTIENSKKSIPKGKFTIYVM
jgi:alanyl-tRNA synthetase